MTLWQYYTMIWGQVELDQFIDGLNAYTLRDMIKQFPQLLKLLFVFEGHPSKQKCVGTYYCMHVDVFGIVGYIL